MRRSQGLWRGVAQPCGRGLCVLRVVIKTGGRQYCSRFEKLLNHHLPILSEQAEQVLQCSNHTSDDRFTNPFLKFESTGGKNTNASADSSMCACSEMLRHFKVFITVITMIYMFQPPRPLLLLQAESLGSLVRTHIALPMSPRVRYTPPSPNLWFHLPWRDFKSHIKIWIPMPKNK